MCIYAVNQPLCAYAVVKIVEENYIMEMTAEPRNSQSPGHTTANQSRACDQCHRRKTGPLFELPNSQFTMPNSGSAACVGPGQTKHQKQRIADFERLEKQLSDIQRTLSMLQSSLMESKVSDYPSDSAEVRDKPDTTANQHPAVVTRDGSSVTSSEMLAYEGASSLSVQSHLASEIFRDLVKGNPLDSSAPDISMDYSQLDKALNRNDPQSLLYDKSFPETKHQEKSQGNIPTLLSFLPLVSISELDSLCKKAYFEMEECTTSDLIIMNACLLFLLPEYCISQSNDDSVTAKCRLNSLLCQRNLELALSRLNLFMNLSLDNAKALILASMYAIGTHSLSMAWTLISTAARLCHSLGHHCLTVQKNTSSSDENTKRVLFGYVYILDQTLSLRLGRPSSLRECDLATDSLPTTSTSDLQVSDFVWSLWIEAAKLHAWTFERLYSPKAMELSQNARTEAMRNLALLTLAAKSRNSKLEGQFCDSGASPHQYLDFVQRANDVVFLSLLTLIYRSIPNESSDTLSPFNQQCLEAARRHSQHTISAMTVLACPIIPFLVMFCHAVTTLSLETMEDLEKFVTSLQPVTQTYIAGSKTHALCQRFYNAGKSYIETQLQRQKEASMTDTCPDLGATIFTDIIPEFWHVSDGTSYTPGNSGLNTPGRRQMQFGQDLMSEEDGWFFGDPTILGLADDIYHNIGNSFDMENASMVAYEPFYMFCACLGVTDFRGIHGRSGSLSNFM
ncbi:fungal specific transcription factor domain-containing protein [Botrytis cinerea]